MARRRSLLALACAGALHACMMPYSTPQPFAVETGGKAPDDGTTGDGTTAAETTDEAGTSTGAVTATTGASTGGSSSGTTTGEATTEALTSTSTGTTAADTTTGDPHDVCIASYEFGDECGECICDKCLDPWQKCAADEGCVKIRACAVLTECAGFECEGPCATPLFEHGGLWGPSGSLAVLLGQCATQKCGIYCKV